MIIMEFCPEGDLKVALQRMEICGPGEDRARLPELYGGP